MKRIYEKCKKCDWTVPFIKPPAYPLFQPIENPTEKDIETIARECIERNKIVFDRLAEI